MALFEASSPACGEFVVVGLRTEDAIFHSPAMKYEYKVVPFIGSVKSGQGADIAAQQLQSVIAQHATGGWDFVQLGDVNIEIQPGCLAGLLGQKASYIRFDQVIFRRTNG